MERRLSISAPPGNRHPGDQEGEPEHHREGVVEEVARLRPPASRVKNGTIPMARPLMPPSMTSPVAARQRMRPSPKARRTKSRVVDLVEVPLVEQEAVERRLVPGQTRRGRSGWRMYMSQARTKPSEHRDEGRDLDPDRRMVRFVHHVVVRRHVDRPGARQARRLSPRARHSVSTGSVRAATAPSTSPWAASSDAADNALPSPAVAPRRAAVACAAAGMPKNAFTSSCSPKNDAEPDHPRKDRAERQHAERRDHHHRALVGVVEWVFRLPRASPKNVMKISRQE